MTEPFLAEIRLMSFNFAPKGWAMCDGALLPINQNQAIFSLLGTTYGGDGRVNFGLPDLRARTAMGVGKGHVLGERAGEYTHTLTPGEIPAHAHEVKTAATSANRTSPSGAYLAAPGKVAFGVSPSVAFTPATVSTVGGSQPHENMPPYLAVGFMIALQGIFPSQN